MNRNFCGPYCYQRYKNGDVDARAAFELHRDRESIRCILLHCLLLRGEYDYAEIAKKVGSSEVSIGVYGTLFWNVRDRLEDSIYINTLVYPESRQVQLVPGYALYEHPMNLALRATMDHGIEAAEEFLGLKFPAVKPTILSEAEDFAAMVLSTGNFLAKMNFLHQDLPGLAEARSCLRSRKASGRQPKADRSAKPTVTYSVSEAIELSLNKMMVGKRQKPSGAYGLRITE